jgi:hypothetical protein
VHKRAHDHLQPWRTVHILLPCIRGPMTICNLGRPFIRYTLQLHKGGPDDHSRPITAQKRPPWPFVAEPFVPYNRAKGGLMTIHTLSPSRRGPMTVCSTRTFVPHNRANEDPMAAHTLLPRRRRPHERVQPHRHSSSDKGTEQNTKKT